MNLSTEKTGKRAVSSTQMATSYEKVNLINVSTFSLVFLKLFYIYTKTKEKKVIAFLSEHFRNKYGFWPDGTYCSVLSDDGGTLYVCFNTQRNTKVWDHCTLFAVHIPESERQP